MSLLNRFKRKKEVVGEIIIEELPEKLKAWELINKGAALGKLGKYQEALVCFDKALEINPRLPEAWYNKGVTLGKLGRYQEALVCSDKAKILKMEKIVSLKESDYGEEPKDFLYTTKTFNRAFKDYNIQRKCRVEYYNPAEVNHEYPLKIELLKKEYEELLDYGIEVKWENLRFVAEEKEPEVEIVPISTFFIFAPAKRILKIKANQDEYVDFKMRPTSLPDNPKTCIGIEFLYKNKSVGKINIDLKIQNKFRIIDDIKISHEEWGEVITIAGGMTTIGLFLHFFYLLFESLKYAWISHLGFLLIASSFPAFCLGVYLGKNKSRKISASFG